nr:tetratricopeptide repeat protein [Acetobacter garciniae]
MKAERLRVMARRYAGVAAGLVLVVLAGAGAWSWRASQHKAAAVAATGQYLTALRQTDNLPVYQPGPPVTPLSGNAQTGLQTLTRLASTGPEGVAVLARMQEAAVQATRGDLKAALAAWDAVQGNEKADPAMRDLAMLLWCQQQIDTGDIAVLRSRLSVLVGKGKTWYGLATEALAMLDVREGHLEDARKKFAALVMAADVPPGVRNRAQDMTQALDPSAG